MKVRIYQNQVVPENPTLRVLSPTADYGPFELIQCGDIGSGLATAAFQAQFVKFGGLVYREQEYIEVLSKLGLVDLKPDTLADMLTSDKTSIVVDRDPLDNIPEEAVQEIPTSAAVEAEQYATTTEPVTDSVPVPDTPSDPVLPLVEDTNVSTTTPDLPFDVPADTSSTTAALSDVVESLTDATSTTP